MIVRSPRPDANFYVLNKAISEDRRLSWAARGLLVYLLGKPDNWKVMPAALVNETAGSARPAGRDLVYGLLAELKTAGYLTQRQDRNADGSMGSVSYLVSEQPLPANPDAAPLPALPDPVNPPLPSIEENQGHKKKELRARERSTWEESAGIVVPSSVMATLEVAYGSKCDVRAEIAKATAWCRANPTRAPRRDFDRFVNGWLNRAAERPAAPRARPQSKHDRHMEFMGRIFGANDVLDVSATIIE